MFLTVCHFAGNQLYYDIRNATCCGANITLKRDNIECCGGQLYNTTKQICCDGLIFNNSQERRSHLHIRYDIHSHPVINDYKL